MALGGVIGNGTKVGFSASSPLSFTRVGQLRDIPTFLSLVAADLDTTIHSTSNVMTSAPGMIPPPEFEMDLLGDLDQATSPSHETLRQYAAGSGLSAAGTVIWFRIEVPVNRAQSSFRAFEFQGYVKEYTPNIKIADLQSIKILVKYAGNLAVYNAAASQIS